MSPRTRQDSCRFTPRRRLAVGGLVLTSTLISGMFLSSAAFATTPVPSATTVTSKADLTTAFQNAIGTVTLGASLTEPLSSSSTSEGTETVPAHATMTLDLAGHSLDLDRLVLGDGSSLTVTDSSRSTSFDDDNQSSGNKLQVDASNTGSGSATAIELTGHSQLHIERATIDAEGGDGGAGIGSAADDTTGGGTLLVDGSASVSATGGRGGAGIGGGARAKAIATTVSGADVHATGGAGGAGIGSGRSGTDSGSLTTTTSSSSSNYGYTYISADGGSDAAGVGGGYGAGGAIVQLNSSGSLDATQGMKTLASDTASAIGAGAAGSSFGALTIGANANVDLYRGTVMHVPAGTTIPNAGDIDLGGLIDGEGTIANTGSIDLEQRYDDNGDVVTDTDTHIAESVNVTGHNYLLTLNPNGGTQGGDHTVHLWSDAFRSYNYPQPTPASSDLAFFTWNTQADGTGTGGRYIDVSDITSAVSDGQAVPITLYAKYGHPAKLTGTSLADAGLGVPYDQTIPASGDGLDYFSAGDYDDQENPIAGLPAGLSLDSSTGRITGVPTEAGSYRVRVYASNDYTQDSGYVTIEVAGAPAIATAALPDATAGTAYSSSVRATGKGTVSYSIASGSLPAGLVLNSVTGAISGTPTAAGPRAFVVRATSTFGSSLQPLVLTVAAAPAQAPAAVAPAAPTLAAVGRTTVRFGHRLDLAVTANSTLQVTYRVTSGSLPAGITLNAQTGVVSGVATEEGTFTAIVTVTSSAGSASTPVVIEVPQVKELIATKGAVPDVKIGSGSVPLKIAGLKKGEHWTLRVDGHVVKRGTMKKAGSLATSVTLKKVKKDTVHTVQISGSRKVSDPAQRASTAFQITSLAAKKTLKVTSTVDQRGIKQVVVDKLAAGERVVVRDGSKVIAKGHADENGDFAFPQSKAGSGKSRLTVHGATEKRAGKLTVKNSKKG